MKLVFKALFSAISILAVACGPSHDGATGGACTAPADCRSDYQCFNGACRPMCHSDPECGLGFVCTSGLCTTHPGATLGAACTKDDDCSSQLCQDNVCVQSCTHDSACGDANTCIPSNFDDINLRRYCIARRGTAPPEQSCLVDDDCDRGICQLGMCVELCEISGDCHASGMECADMPMYIGSGSQTFGSCLPASGLIEFDADPSSDLSVPVPATAQSLTLFFNLPTFQFDNIVGVLKVTAPDETILYDDPPTLDGYYSQPVRYFAEESSSTMLVPNSDRVRLQTGIYEFVFGSSKGTQLTPHVYLKMNARKTETGTVPLTFYLTDLSQSCMPKLDTSSAAATLADVVTTVKAIYATIGITVDPVQFKSAPAGTLNTVRLSSSLPDVDEALQKGTSSGTGLGGFDVVLLSSITDGQGMPNGIIGFAGGIPTSPLLGTPHSGAVVSIGAYCFLTNKSDFSSAVAHELGHSTGLSHSVESDGHTDLITDTDGSNSNLMYWLEYGGTMLTEQQGQVVRNDPKVRQ